MEFCPCADPEWPLYRAGPGSRGRAVRRSARNFRREKASRMTDNLRIIVPTSPRRSSFARCRIIAWGCLISLNEVYRLWYPRTDFPRQTSILRGPRRAVGGGNRSHYSRFMLGFDPELGYAHPSADLKYPAQYPPIPADSQFEAAIVSCLQYPRRTRLVLIS